MGLRYCPRARMGVRAATTLGLWNLEPVVQALSWSKTLSILEIPGLVWSYIRHTETPNSPATADSEIYLNVPW